MRVILTPQIKGGSPVMIVQPVIFLLAIIAKHTKECSYENSNNCKFISIIKCGAFGCIMSKCNGL